MLRALPHRSLKYAKAPEDDTAPPQKLQDTARVPVPRLHLAMHAFQLWTCVKSFTIHSTLKRWLHCVTLVGWTRTEGWFRRQVCAFLRLTISEAEIFEHASLAVLKKKTAQQLRIRTTRGTSLLHSRSFRLNAKLHEDPQKDAMSPPPFAPRCPKLLCSHPLMSKSSDLMSFHYNQ